MAKYLLRVEALNFDSFILDTDDLSTIRGAGLLILEPPDIGRTPIYRAASTALYEIDAEPDQLDKIRDDAHRQLHRDKHAQATFSVTITPAAGTFESNHHQAIAATRWSQFQTPTVVLPAPGDGVCRIDRIRPEAERRYRKGAAFTQTGQPEKIGFSSATAVRREYGIEEKHRIHEERFRSSGEVTNDFHQITDYTEAGNLHHKMAVIYLDGNGFGAITRGCKTDKVLGDWSKTVTTNQDAFFRWLHTMPVSPVKPHWHWTGDVVDNDGNSKHKQDAFRFEVLLWGADEFAFVVPAWAGWWALEKFYELYGRLRGSQASFANKRLTHKAGLVFCHHNAPIRRIFRLAKGLCDESKGDGNRVLTQVLESFDHNGADEQAFWQQRLPAPLTLGGLSIPGDAMPVARKAIISLKNCVARSRLHDTLTLLCRQRDLEKGIKEGAAALSRAQRNDSEVHKYFDTLAKAVAGQGEKHTPTPAQQAAAWILLGELWDYVGQPAWPEPPADLNGEVL